MMIGIIGLVCDLLLARLSKHLFPWERFLQQGGNDESVGIAQLS